MQTRKYGEGNFPTSTSLRNNRWLKPNESSRLPRTHIVLDSEAVIEETASGTVHRFRCAVTTCDKLSRRNNQWQEPQYAEHHSPREVWEWITGRTSERGRTIVVAHNSGYDLRITEAFTVLPSLGWELGMVSLAPGATWCSWRNGKRSLSIIDSLAWFPTNLANIGKAIGMDKPTLPGPDDSETEWFTRCRADVFILRKAWLDTLEWLRNEDCGNWKPTGAGQGFAAFRHKHLTHKILIHDDQEVREYERQAAWTGRAEPWRFGSLQGGPFTEWDYRCAYATIAGDSFVPTRFRGEVINPHINYVRGGREHRKYLSCVQVETETPTVPCHSDGRIVWPTGKFDTVLWDNELRLAIENGAKVTITRQWSYDATPALQAWSEWCLGLVDNRSGDVPPIARVLAKHWCRSTIGRFGSRFPSWEPFGESRQATPRLSGYVDWDTKEVGQLLEVGSKAFLSLGVQDHPQSVPQVMSWIMAECRVRLWHAMEVAGFENVVYVDTDSLIVDTAGNERLRVAELPGLRRKSEYRTLTVLGTRQLVENGTLKAAGVPRGAVRTGQNTWSGEAWSSMAASLSEGDLASVRVRERSVTLRDTDGRRINSDGSISLPYRIGKIA